jgi:hypothetical protein
MKCINRTLQLGALLAATAFSLEGNGAALPNSFPSLAVPVIVRHVGLADGLFPLTLTLSLGLSLAHIYL